MLFTTTVMTAWPVAAQAQVSNTTVARDYNIPSKALSDALADFGLQSGLQVSVDAARLRGLHSAGVSGRMPAAQALERLLAGSGLTWRLTGNLVTLDAAPAVLGDTGGPQPLVTEALRVDGAVTTGETGAERDARRRDEVYDLDASSTFAGREEVERYKGVTPSDVLRGMVNVFSGDARNSGALDPSIRGIQGPGRVPVIIDGTEQALTVWRGYNGASNRSYIDPGLISGIQVLKGPVSARGVNGSVGGAVVVNTLDADDILKPGETFGIELRLEGGNNSAPPRLPTLLTGQDFRTVAGFPGAPGVPGNPTFPYADPSLRIDIRTAADNDFVSLGDKAARVAVAGRVGDFDLFGAYARRKRGNYFSGGNGAGYYAQEDLEPSSATYIQRMALNYGPGNEVPNTSSETESWLFKATWRIADDQYLQLGFRDSKSDYGEIMPSRISASDDFGAVQWPLSKVHIQAYNAEYKWQPDSRWIDFKANLWATRTGSHTYSAGGFPNSASYDDPIIINSALANSRNNRIGVTASNQMKLSPRLDLLLEGSWQHEQLRSSDPFDERSVADGWRQFPRAGRREEYRITLRGEWRPTSFLKLNAGLTYSGYWAVDDFLRGQIAAGNGDLFVANATTSYSMSYQTEEFGADAYQAYMQSFYEALGFPSDLAMILAMQAAQDYAANPFPFTATHSGPAWEPDAEGRYHRADNICTNGALDGIATYNGVCLALPNLQAFSADAGRKSGHGWAPTLSATAYLSGSSRVYLRYAEAYRFPSMFESTIGFSASINPLARLKPEHLHSWEAAYVQDLRDLFGLETGQQADLKLTWYHNKTRNVIERTTRLMFSNVDRHVVAGFELQARYDNDGFFTEFSAGHMTTNKVCDESVAVQLDLGSGRIPDCVKYGFFGGYLLTQAIPEDTINWTIGGRFLDRRLELGGRLIYYGAYDNPQLAEFVGGDDPIDGYALNVPYAWGETITFDAYVRFRLNDRFSAELVGTNLTDRYFADPLTRALNPAPGRTVRLSLTGRF